jgi:hypothetical protein
MGSSWVREIRSAYPSNCLEDSAKYLVRQGSSLALICMLNQPPRCQDTRDMEAARSGIPKFGSAKLKSAKSQVG